MKNGNEDMDDYATHDKCCYARRQRQENTDRAKNPSDCMIRQRALNTPYSGCEVIFPNPEEAREILSKISARVIR